MKNLFLMWREPITEYKADPAVPSLCRDTEESERTLIAGHRCFYLTLSAHARHRRTELPASAGAGRRPPVCLEQCTGSEKGSASHHRQWGEPPTTPWLSTCPKPCTPQPRGTLSSRIHAPQMMLILTQKQIIHSSASWGDFPKRR